MNEGPPAFAPRAGTSAAPAIAGASTVFAPRAVPSPPASVPDGPPTLTPRAMPAPVPAAASPIATATATAVAEPVADEGAELTPELEARWRDVLGGINARKRMLGAFLEVCRFAGRRGHELLVGMDDLRRVVVEEQENRALIGEEIRRVFGAEGTLRCVSGTAGDTAVDDVKPLVDRAIAWFDGEAIDRRPREERPVR